MSEASKPLETPPNSISLWLRCALFVSVAGVVGSLYLSLNMELKACSLCLYQRAFIMASASVLAFGLFLPGVPTATLAPLALASASAGTCVAVFHTYLEQTGVLECPAGITGRITAPAESLFLYLLLVVLLLGDLFTQRKYVPQGLGAILVGFVFASTSIRATPPSPTPTAPYELEYPDGCRKVYKVPTQRDRFSPPMHGD